MFIECCCRLYFKGNRKHESRCFGMTIAEEVFQDLQLLKKISSKWVASFGVGNYALTLSTKRLTKDDEYPGSRFLMAETQAGWDSISKFHSNDPKTHSFYGNYMYLCCCKKIVRFYGARPVAGTIVRFFVIF